MKEFNIIQTCSICGEEFDSDYKLAKHIGKYHRDLQIFKEGMIGGDGRCSCGKSHQTENC